MFDFFSRFKKIDITVVDLWFFLITAVFFVWLFWSSGVTIIALGGVVLIYSSWLTYKGQIYLALGSYLVADVCWVLNSVVAGDMVGATLIIIGIILGLLTAYKMNTDVFNKDVLTEKK